MPEKSSDGITEAAGECFALANRSQFLKKKIRVQISELSSSYGVRSTATLNIEH
jgi:hypothetical protein